MTDTKELLIRIAALKQRLSTDGAPGVEHAGETAHAIEEKLQHGTEHGALIDTALQAALPVAPGPLIGGPVRLAGRGARLLRKGRDALQALRTIAANPEFQDPEGSSTLEQVHREATSMIEMILRTVGAFPTEMSTQMRMCDGLEIVLAEVDERIALLSAGLEQRALASAQVNELAECLRLLAAKQPVSLTPLQTLADALIAEARSAMPLRVLYARPTEPARFAAAHGINVAQVLARLLLGDAEWQPQIQLAVMAALVHDVGMVCVPAEVLSATEPLSPEDRRLIEKHTTVAEVMLTRLWPGGGWPVEAASQHHERNDGAGYPLGEKATRLSTFARLIAVCDVYAALCAPRPHRPAFDTRTALTETLLLAERDYLDKSFAERLLLLTFYPVGTAVELNDGAIGFVLDTPPGADGMTPPDRPIVHLVHAGQGAPHAWPNVVDLRGSKDRRIIRGLTVSERRVRLGKLYPHML